MANIWTICAIGKIAQIKHSSSQIRTPAVNYWPVVKRKARKIQKATRCDLEMAKTMQLLLASLLVVGTTCAITNETTPDPSAYQPLICVVVGNQFFAKLKTESGSDQDPGDLWWRMVSERWDSDEAGINIFPFPGFIITRKSN